VADKLFVCSNKNNTICRKCYRVWRNVVGGMEAKAEAKEKAEGKAKADKR
jgi:hypothetical protein